jgi:drug/metabolite transporter (DMT)-like permease
MEQRTLLRTQLCGIGFLVGGLFIFSVQDIVVKLLGGHYPILEIVTLRSLVALPLTIWLFRLEGGLGWPQSQQTRLEVFRGLCYFLSYTTHFMGLAALPLADIAAIRFSGPLMITLLSVLFLGEHVNAWRWLALCVGFGGTLLVVQPGLDTFNVGSLFIVISVLFYALAIMLTRPLQRTDSSATMAFYSSLVYLAATAVLAPVALWVGERPDAHPSVAFLLHAWSMPTLATGLMMAGLGVTWAAGMYVVARAYSSTPASVVAPFEYMALPISVAWGFLLWHEWPSMSTWAGAALTILCGLAILFLSRPKPQ